jgi:beta-1,2-mannobiose phosphorylase / 1,2-beta-oligomannan phosphorylase
MPLIKRWGKNPILGPNADLPWAKDEARNPGVIYDGTKIRMVFTTASDYANYGEMVLGYAESTDGIHFECAPEPFLEPSRIEGDFDFGTVEDSRITQIDDTFYIAYAGRCLHQKRFLDGDVCHARPNNHPTWTQLFRRVGLLATKDWKTVTRLGPITSEHLSDANVALFPEKIDGKYVMLHRPSPHIAFDINTKYAPSPLWIAFSESLTDWGWDEIPPTHGPWKVGDIDHSEDYLLIKPEYEWERLKVGGAGVPIPTDEGWLMLYHAVDINGVYRVGLLLLDREDPREVLARSPQPIMEPEAPYELDGPYPKCIFPCAHIVMGDEVFIYYGAVDQYCCLATVKLKDLLDYALSCRC